MTEMPYELQKLPPPALDVLRYFNGNQNQPADDIDIMDGANLSQRSFSKAIKRLITKKFAEMDFNRMYTLSSKGMDIMQQLLAYDAATGNSGYQSARAAVYDDDDDDEIEMANLDFLTEDDDAPLRADLSFLRMDEDAPAEDAPASEPPAVVPAVVDAPEEPEEDEAGSEALFPGFLTEEPEALLLPMEDIPLAASQRSLQQRAMIVVPQPLIVAEPATVMVGFDPLTDGASATVTVRLNVLNGMLESADETTLSLGSNPAYGTFTVLADPFQQIRLRVQVLQADHIIGGMYVDIGTAYAGEPQQRQAYAVQVPVQLHP